MKTSFLPEGGTRLWVAFQKKFSWNNSKNNRRKSTLQLVRKDFGRIFDRDIFISTGNQYLDLVKSNCQKSPPNR